MSNGSWSRLCGGNVQPSVFVVLQSDNTVVQAGSNADVWGISQPSTHNYPLSGLDDGYAGIIGSPPINIFGPGDDGCLLRISATVTAGQELKSDASGYGTPVTADGDKVGAVAVQGGVSGDLIPVKPRRYDRAS
jgi:hypothetical protein